MQNFSTIIMSWKFILKQTEFVRRIVKWNLYSEGSLMIQELKFDPIFLQSKHYLHNAFESKRNWDITILA